MSLSAPLLVYGVPASPYTRKLLATLRYWRLPYQFRVGSWAEISNNGLPQPKVIILPTVYWQDSGTGEFQVHIDSTPMIRELQPIAAERVIIPANPVLSFINDLIEDYADEWLTKCMFHYRWEHEENAELLGTVLPLMHSTSLPEETLLQFKQHFSSRQIERLGLVGSNAQSKPVIERSFVSFLQCLQNCLTERAFLFGEQPSSADFAIYGQLTQLALFDPTSAKLTAAIAPRVVAWVMVMEDLSGLEPTSAAGDFAAANETQLASGLKALLQEIGQVYVPFLLANERAIEQGDTELNCTTADVTWRQPVFPYQLKCLQQLRSTAEALSPADQQQLESWLQGSGCDAIFQNH